MKTLKDIKQEAQNWKRKQAIRKSLFVVAIIVIFGVVINLISSTL